MFETELKTISDFNLSESVKSQLGLKVKCDECGETFSVKEIEVSPFGSNFNVINPMVALKLFVQPEGYLINVSDTYLLSKDSTYYVLKCPKCHEVHLFGMDVVK